MYKLFLGVTYTVALTSVKALLYKAYSILNYLVVTYINRSDS